MGRFSVRKTLKFKGKQHFAGFKSGRRITGNFRSKAAVRSSGTIRGKDTATRFAISKNRKR